MAMQLIMMSSILSTPTTKTNQPKVLSDRQLSQQDHPSTAEQMHEVHEKIQMDFIKSSKVPLWTIGKGTDSSKAGACLQGREGEGFGVSAIFAHCLFQIDIDEEGKESLMRLAQGDMRKVLNILQVGTDSVD